jgi:hypothetical protein
MKCAEIDDVVMMPAETIFAHPTVHLIRALADRGICPSASSGRLPERRIYGNPRYRKEIFPYWD